MHQRAEFRIAAEERRPFVGAPAARRCERGRRAERLDRFVAAPQTLGAEGVVGDDLARRGVGGRPDDDFAGRRDRLEPLRGVHHIAHHGDFAAGPHCADHGLPGVDADAHLHRDAEAGRERRDRRLHLQRGSHRPFGVVFVRNRGAELGDDLVADDLVEAPAERGDVTDEALETVVDESFDLLRVGFGRHRREADEVAHEHGDHAPLVGCRDQALPALGAEACASRNRHAARRAGHAPRLPPGSRATSA